MRVPLAELLHRPWKRRIADALSGNGFEDEVLELTGACAPEGFHASLALALDRGDVLRALLHFFKPNFVVVSAEPREPREPRDPGGASSDEPPRGSRGSRCPPERKSLHPKLVLRNL